jgi:hypothetical protein
MVPATPARSLNLGMVMPFAKNAGIATWPPTTRKPGEYPATANILGAPVIGTDRSTGVIDRYNHAFGYEDLLVCDGRRARVKFAVMSCAQRAFWGQRVPVNMLIYLKFQSILASS